jgi:hypothetical protein
LRRDIGRWWWCLDNSTTATRLRDGLWCWNGLCTLASGDCDAARHDCGGGDAETCARDEVAAGHNGSSTLSTFSGFWTS